MTEFSEGDLIEATTGENIVRGRLTEDTCAGDLCMHGWCIKPLLRDGYTVTLVEKAAPALPTEPGFYLNRRSELWTLEKSGEWRNDYDDTESPAAVFNSAPFIRLEPVPSTASRVLDRVREEAFGSLRAFGPTALDKIGAEFGVEK